MQLKTSRIAVVAPSRAFGVYNQPRVLWPVRREWSMLNFSDCSCVVVKMQSAARNEDWFPVFPQITHRCSVDDSGSSRSLGGQLGHRPPLYTVVPARPPAGFGPSAFEATLAWLKHSLIWKEPVERFRLLPSNNCRKPIRALSDLARISSPLLLLQTPSSRLPTTNKHRQQHPLIEASYPSRKTTSIITIQNGSWKPARQGSGEEPQEAGQ